MTGFGRVTLLPGIWPSLHLDTTVALPVGVEAFAAYALRAWLSRETWISARWSVRGGQKIFALLTGQTCRWTITGLGRRTRPQES